MGEPRLNPAEIQQDHAIVHFFALLAGVDDIDARARLLVSGMALFLRMDAAVLAFTLAAKNSASLYTWQDGVGGKLDLDQADHGALEGVVVRKLQEFAYPFTKTQPLVYQGRVIGCLGVARKHPQEMAAEEEFLLNSAQTLTALLLANYRAVIQLKEQSEQLQAALEALRRHDTQLRIILDNLPVGVLFTDAEGNVVFGNPAAQQIWAGIRYVGAAEYPVYRAWWHDTGKVVEAQEWAVSRALASGRSFLNDILDIESFDGARKTILNSAVPIHDEDGRVLGAVAINQDITERERSQESLMRAEKLASAGRLAASIAHEINNPLEGVTNLVYLALREPSASDAVRQLLLVAEQELQRMSHIAKTSLGFYRDRSAPIVVEVTSVLDEVLALYARKLQQQDIRVERRYSPGITASVNAGETRQLFSNLVANAIDAMPAGGRLVVRVTQSRCWKHPDLPGVRVSIGDTGMGIRSDHLPRIFEAFFTTKATVGTGLGLWLSKNIVEKHGGVMSVRSTPERGTVFSIFLPAQAAPADLAAGAGAGS